MSVIDFEHERAQRSDGWTLWSDAEPAPGLVIRLRGTVKMTGGGELGPGSKFVRRGQALCLIPEGGVGAMQMVCPPYRSLEWMPG